MSVAVAAPSLAELELATLRLAIHEAGHAVATVLLGHRIDGLTIDLDEGLSGCSFWDADPLPEAALNSCGRIFFLDWRMRKRLEDELALTLAAHVASPSGLPSRLGTAQSRRPRVSANDWHVSLNTAALQSRSSDGTQHRPLNGKATRRPSQNSVASDRAVRKRLPRFSTGCSPRFAIGLPRRSFRGRSPRSRAHYRNTPTCREPRYIG